MTPLLIAFPGQETFCARLAEETGAGYGRLSIHRFPDGESLPRLPPLLGRQSVAFLCTLDRPDEKILPLLFAARTARELGASRVGLIAPYLAYMRQDHRFAEGEAVTSVHFAGLICDHFDWLVTVDPHLHRHKSLSDIYAIPASVCHADRALANWIEAHVKLPVLIGPDEESRQWVADIAARIGAPWTVLSKTRTGDESVRETLADAGVLPGRRPVIVDDILSTGRTAIAAANLLRAHFAAEATFLAIHAVFAGDAAALMASSGIRIVTTNSIAHASNEIDIVPLLADEVRPYLSFPEG